MLNPLKDNNKSQKLFGTKISTRPAFFFFFFTHSANRINDIALVSLIKKPFIQ